MGIIMVLLGLMLPSLGKARTSASLSTQLREIQQAHLLLAMYASANSEHYPLRGDNQHEATTHWFEPLVESGLLAGSDQLDRSSSQRGLEPPFAMSASLCSAADYYRPEHETYPDESARPVSSVRTDQVLYPSSKGAIFTWRIGNTTEPFIVPWCCLDTSLAAPIAFADGSAEARSVDECFVVQPMRTEELAGIPVYTTWYGIHGRDR